MTPETITEPVIETATTTTFTLTPAKPGTPKKVRITEDSAKLAFNVGLVSAMTEASWLAFVYGTVVITSDASDMKWTMTVEQSA